MVTWVDGAGHARRKVVVGWLVCVLGGRQVGFIRRMTVPLLGWLGCWLIYGIGGWMLCRLAGWLVEWVRGSVGYWVGWLIGRSVGWEIALLVA